MPHFATLHQTAGGMVDMSNVVPASETDQLWHQKQQCCLAFCLSHVLLLPWGPQRKRNSVGGCKFLQRKFTMSSAPFILDSAGEGAGGSKGKCSMWASDSLMAFH